MGVRRGGIIALPVLALLVLGACGGESRVLTTREYADTVVAARQESAENIDGLAEKLLEEIKAIQARFEEDTGDLEDDLNEADSSSDAFAAMRPHTEDFAEAILDSFGAFIRSAVQVVEDHVARLKRLKAPAHVSEHHERLVLALESFHGHMESFVSDLRTIDREFPTLDDFEAFEEEFTQLVADWDLEALDDDADAACRQLKEVLEADLGSLDICD